MFIIQELSYDGCTFKVCLYNSGRLCSLHLEVLLTLQLSLSREKRPAAASLIMNGFSVMAAVNGEC